MNKKAKVYIASPYTKGDTAVNVRVSADMFSLLVDMGCSPFCPLTTHFLHMMNPKPYRTWMEYDFEWVDACNILFRVPGISMGGDLEIERAEKNSIPVVRDIEELLDCLKDNQWHINHSVSKDVAILRYRKIINIDADLYI